MVVAMSATAQAPRSEPAERSSFSRVRIDLLGRFMREDRTEFPCRAENMSPGDVSVTASVVPVENERIIVYIDHIGRLEGAVSRVFEGGFDLAFQSTPRKREKLAAQLTWFANRHELSLPEDRRHERNAPENPFVDMVLDDGRRYPAQIIDLSLSGAAVTSSIRPAVGSRITLGTTTGRIVRHIEDGFAVEFSAERAWHAPNIV